jgi:hypothetical protein
MLSRQEVSFIKDALTEAIGWAEYASDYFQQKHDLSTDKENVEKSIKILDELESRTCETCAFFNNTEIDENSFSDCGLGVETSYKKMVYKGFGCNDWKAK